MATLKLPKAPYEHRHTFTRNNIAYEAVKGFNSNGRGYMYIEDVKLYDDILKKRKVCRDFLTEFDDDGALTKITATWRTYLYNPVTGKKYEAVDETSHYTNEADLIFFSAFLGDPIMASSLNGAVRGPVMGFNDQPIVNPDGSWRPDVIYEKNADGTTKLDAAGNPIVDTVNSYDTTKAPDDEAYGKVQPEYEPEPTPDGTTV